ncbi:arsenate reductase (glutaredoxin) [Aestuariispira insulae]|uniref:Arsenate reductase n=1 Tax=Aestuariispira insulae TaxID=1461337 RepID=A0A3D9HW34_9PROT|nr:arsenate reductase (glutaredoxin) [Aestuariispira insulae]RED53629.1 arsenate reductase [Aestuariispira insulae]
MSVKILHNPRCSKSRQTLALLVEKGVTPEIVEYLKAAPSMAEIKDIAAKLGVAPREMMRKGEAVYKEMGLKDVDDDQALIQAMADNPILIERPIVLANGKAKIGRPPESVLEIL